MIATKKFVLDEIRLVKDLLEYDFSRAINRDERSHSRIDILRDTLQSRVKLLEQNIRMFQDYLGVEVRDSEAQYYAKKRKPKK